MSTFHFAARSRNAKTGPIPVTTTSNDTCPASCPFKGKACYAEAGFHSRLHWQKVTAGKRGGSLQALLSAIGKLKPDTLWRHNQAGDLPGDGETIDAGAVAAITAANKGKRGFTYTHKPMTADNIAIVRAANADGFTVNLSANNTAHADELAALNIAPVVVVLPEAVHGNQTLATPAGRKIVVCPATYRDEVTCASCGLCQRQRTAIVGFPAHGTQAAAADAIASL